MMTDNHNNNNNNNNNNNSNTAFYLPEPPEDGANKIDMALHDIQKKEWLLLEGTVCGIGKIADRTSKKQMK